MQIGSHPRSSSRRFAIYFMPSRTYTHRKLSMFIFTYINRHRLYKYVCICVETSLRHILVSAIDIRYLIWTHEAAHRLSRTGSMCSASRGRRLPVSTGLPALRLYIYVYAEGNCMHSPLTSNPRSKTSFFFTNRALA